jgi:hypothetical protein
MSTRAVSHQPTFWSTRSKGGKVAIVAALLLYFGLMITWICFLHGESKDSIFHKFTQNTLDFLKSDHYAYLRFLIVDATITLFACLIAGAFIYKKEDKIPTEEDAEKARLRSIGAPPGWELGKDNTGANPYAKDDDA